MNNSVSLEKLRAEWQGETVRGRVVDNTGENPVISAVRHDLPNIIVSNEDASNYDLEDLIKVQITDIPQKTYFFGEKIKEKKERKKKTSPDYRVKFSLFGIEFTSDSFDTEEGASDMKKFLKKHLGKGEVVRER